MGRLKDYLKENWGAPFIVGFQALLLACAGLSVQGNSGLASELAAYAYYLLVIGVILQLTSFMKARVRVRLKWRLSLTQCKPSHV